MSNNHPTSTSMASVWETLNRMKERQAKVQSKTPRQHTSHRRDAIALFEREICAAAKRGETDGQSVLTHMREVMDADEHVRSLIDEHRQRAIANPSAELKAVEKAIIDIREELSVSSASLRRANDVAHRMKLELS